MNTKLCTLFPWPAYNNVAYAYERMLYKKLDCSVTKSALAMDMLKQCGVACVACVLDVSVCMRHGGRRNAKLWCGMICTMANIQYNDIQKDKAC